MVALPKPKLSDDFVVPEPGVYLMEFIGYDEPQQSPFDPDKFTIKLKFNVVDDEFGGCKVNEFYGWSTHPSSKLYPVLKALNGGAELDFGDEEDDEEADGPDLDDFVGRQFMGTLDNITKPRKNGNPGETVTFAKLVAAAPVKKKKKTEPAANVTDIKKRKAADPTWDDEDDE